MTDAPTSTATCLRTEADVFTELGQLCVEAGFLHVLAYQCFRDNFITYSVTGLKTDDLSKLFGSDRLVRNEITTLLGLALKGGLSIAQPGPEQMQQLIDRTSALMEELHQALIYPAHQKIIESLNAGHGRSPFTDGSVLREPMFYGAEAGYVCQYLDFAARRYQYDADWLKDNFGFQINDAVGVVKAIFAIQRNRASRYLPYMKGMPLHRWTLLPLFIVSADEIVRECRLEKSLVLIILSSFANGPYCNNGFNNINDYNLAASRPLIKINADHFVSLQDYALAEALYESPAYWMMKDKNYTDSHAIHRGVFTEQTVFDRMISVFGQTRVDKNVILTRGGRTLAEADVAVRVADSVIVFQCKAKRLTLAARGGSDWHINKDFTAAIQDAYDQGVSFGQLITGDVAVGSSAPHITHFKSLRKIYVCTITSENYPALTTQGRELLKIVLSDVVQPPLITDVFLIDVLAEFLSSPLLFLSYLDRRVNYHERIIANSEISIVGYHLDQNLWLDDEHHFAVIDDSWSMPIDATMIVRRDGIAGDADPFLLTKSISKRYIKKILEVIDGDMEWVSTELGLFLLTLSGDTLDHLNAGISRIVSSSRLDRKSHDFSLGFGSASCGITIHSNQLSDSEARSLLFTHVTARKYKEHAARWFGLNIDPVSEELRFGVMLNNEWAFDQNLEDFAAVLKSARDTE